MPNHPIYPHTVLVTGGAGYIGSHIVKTLLEAGIKTVILDNLTTGFKQLVLGDIFIEGDIRDQKLVTELLQTYQVQSVIHLAAYSSVPDSIQNPMDYYDNNTFGTLALLKCCKAQNVQHFIFSSTAAVYDQKGAPMVSEHSPIAPLTPYGKSKYMCEQIIQDVVNTTPLKAMCLRYFNVAGCDLEGNIGQHSPKATHLIKTAAQTICGTRKSIPLYGTDYDTKDGTCIRDYIHVTDLADIHLKALSYLQENGKSTTLNCGYGQGFSVKEVLDLIQDIANTKINIIQEPRRNGDLPALIADCTKIQKLFDWQPQHNNLREIISSALAFEQKSQ